MRQAPIYAATAAVAAEVLIFAISFVWAPRAFELVASAAVWTLYMSLGVAVWRPPVRSKLGARLALVTFLGSWALFVVGAVKIGRGEFSTFRDFKWLIIGQEISLGLVVIAFGVPKPRRRVVPAAFILGACALVALLVVAWPGGDGRGYIILASGAYLGVF